MPRAHPKLHAGGLLATMLALGAAGCAVQAPRKPPATALAPPSLTAAYVAAACTGKRVYRFSDTDSRVLVFVGKAGALSGAGHVHVVTVERIRGFAALGSREAKADLVFPVTAMRVDPPAVRSALGAEYTEADISADQRSGTRSNMLGALDAGRYPWVRLAITRTDTMPEASLQIRLVLHGQTRAFTAPATLQTGASAIVASGSFAILQSDFGIEPYSILFGALRVEDELRIRYHLVFHRWHPPDTTSCSTPLLTPPISPPNTATSAAL
ncbi:MAG: YceI family protein [Gammaproteobacteria bacterium]|nr:YceI family protein [Gammaproteobacteria bacterium]